MKIETRVGSFILVAIGLFFYLSVNIGEFRLNKRSYYSYKAYFEGTGGLDCKAAVKIAGVSVGWVDSIILQEGGKAEVKLRVEKSHKLAKNAYAMIISEGLIGSKSVEIDPGDPNTGILLPNSTLIMPGKSPASVNELLEQFRDIATHVQDIVSSVRTVVSTNKGETQLKAALEGIAEASTRMARFSHLLERTMERNEENINVTMADLKSTMASLKKAIPQATDDLHRVSDSVSTQIDAAGPKITHTFDHVGQIAEKVNNGQGTVGKLVNEEELYKDLKKSVKGLKEYLGKASSIGLYVDMHSENLFRTSNSKGYLELRLRPSHDYFYSIQLVGDKNGSYRRENRHQQYKDINGNVLPIITTNSTSSDDSKWEAMDTSAIKESIYQVPNDILFSFQFGKRFNRLAFRIGLFENTVGAGVDFYVPLHTDKVNWITSLEVFDMNGVNRFNDKRPHLKWINKVYFLKHLYTTFGVDDIISKYTSSPFFGGGIRWGDDDLKMLLGQLGGMVKR